MLTVSVSSSRASAMPLVPNTCTRQMFGTKGMAEARDEDMLTVGMIGGTPQTHTYQHVDSLKVLAESFADAIEGRGPFLVSPDEMLALIGAFEAILTSLKVGAPVPVPA